MDIALGFLGLSFLMSFLQKLHMEVTAIFLFINVKLIMVSKLNPAGEQKRESPPTCHEKSVLLMKAHLGILISPPLSN